MINDFRYQKNQFLNFFFVFFLVYRSLPMRKFQNILMNIMKKKNARW
jgi:hypothetical protein